MNGAESLVHTLLRSGSIPRFANPGTSEMHFVSALDRIPGMRCVLGLQENVVTGAADGCWRLARKPAATLLHCGPGLANGLANLHNARRGRSGIVNVVGDQATYHRPLDAPLTADTEGWARGVSAWVRTTPTPQRVGQDCAAAVQAARSGPGQIATLILPADAAWGEGGAVGEPLEPVAAPQVAPQAIETAARALRSGGSSLILLGAGAMTAEALELAHRVAQATGADMLTETHISRIDRGRGRVPVDRLPYRVDAARARVGALQHLILVGASYPVGFFAYPGKPSTMVPEDCAVHVLARPDQDETAALRALVAALDAPRVALPEMSRAEPGRGALTRQGVARTIAAHIPEEAVVMDEGSLFGGVLFPESYGAPPHTWMQQTGGAIGAGIPMAIGAALAVPGRRVVSLQADGSGLFTVQGLWTQARERLDITTIVFSNRQYAILLEELKNVGAQAGQTARDMLTLGNPDISWVGLAQSFGVEAAQARDCETLGELLVAALRRPGPF